MAKDSFERANKGQYEMLYPLPFGTPASKVDLYEDLLLKAKDIYEESLHGNG